MWAAFSGGWGSRSMRDCVTERLEKEGETDTDRAFSTDDLELREPRRAERLTDSNSKTLILKDSSWT